MSTTTLEPVELTIEELVIECDWDPCTATAEWVVRRKCGCINLNCTFHKDAQVQFLREAMAEGIWAGAKCQGCGQGLIGSKVSDFIASIDRL